VTLPLPTSACGSTIDCDSSPWRGEDRRLPRTPVIAEERGRS
jgi:hypothetical protein